MTLEKKSVDARCANYVKLIMVAMLEKRDKSATDHDPYIITATSSRNVEKGRRLQQSL